MLNRNKGDTRGRMAGERVRQRAANLRNYIFGHGITNVIALTTKGTQLPLGQKINGQTPSHPSHVISGFSGVCMKTILDSHYMSVRTLKYKIMFARNNILFIRTLSMSCTVYIQFIMLYVNCVQHRYAKSFKMLKTCP